MVVSFTKTKTATRAQFLDEDFRSNVLGQRQDSMIMHHIKDLLCYDTAFNDLAGAIPMWYYINHSRMRPNLECTLHHNNVAFFTIEPVLAGQELTFDYKVPDSALGFICTEE